MTATFVSAPVAATATRPSRAAVDRAVLLAQVLLVG
jgi:hypothetical protein